ncbi:hypothetical protein GSI_05474 [Ganoderma sinense ZZ0214-1]|uniref:Uncharacterized protein n=1 Tax=Ganoderma sinense ZZ0214-1 TaxID=1077348 RepID=A0A2G8SEN9_9APHY|nr:hypothetical protein GSI_05474 [Ganoderma sinense ZZ0214-1]
MPTESTVSRLVCALKAVILPKPLAKVSASATRFAVGVSEMPVQMWMSHNVRTSLAATNRHRSRGSPRNVS